MGWQYPDKKIYDMTCITPVFVGSGEVCSPAEYLYDRKKKYVYFPMEGRWIQFLHKNGWMDEFSEYLSGKEKSKQVWEWMRKRGATEEKLASLACAAVPADCDMFSKEARSPKPTLNEIHRLFHSADGSLYIPGSSLKGMFRTAILYRFVKENPDLFREEKEQLNKMYQMKIWEKKKDRYRWKKVAAKIEEKALRCLTLQESEKKGAVHDVLRGLKVSDTFLDEDLCSKIVQRNDVVAEKKRNGQKCNPLPLYCESFKAGSKLRFSITLDKSMMKRIGISSIDQILENVSKHFHDIVQVQKNAFAEFLPYFADAESADACLGGGTGFLQKTLWLALFDEMTAAQRIRDMLDLYFPKHKHTTNDTRISPRTLKMVHTDGDLHMMGLVRFEEVSSE